MPDHVDPFVQILDLVFRYGQNDFQPVKGLPSVSVGDVVRLGNASWRVASMGFTRLP
jgi:hypothetical protein